MCALARVCTDDVSASAHVCVCPPVWVLCIEANGKCVYLCLRVLLV